MIPFTKMHGIGNDFVMVDAVNTQYSVESWAEVARLTADRHKGVGSDGLIVAERGDLAPYRMRMWNPDGSESEMCGNGVRCMALFLSDCGHTQASVVDVETGAGILTLEIVEGRRVRVDMGPARLTRGEIGMNGDAHERFVGQALNHAGREFVAVAVSMGNPHLVLFGTPTQEVPLSLWGPELEHHPEFPNRVNVHFVDVLGPNRLRQLTWERGAGATLACGTGACAVGVAGFLMGRTGRAVTVELPGGELEIEYQESGRVMMTGPAEVAFEGTWNG